MAEAAVLYALDGGVATLTMNRPQVLNGERRARATVMLAYKTAARDALQLGLVWQVFGDDRLQAKALACARRLARMLTCAYDRIKRALAAGSGNGPAAQLGPESRLLGEAMATDDHREGVAEFLAKRAASFKGNRPCPTN